MQGYNTTLTYDATPVEKIESITTPNLTIAAVATKHLTSPDQTETFEPGWKNPGEVTVEKQFVAAEQATLYGIVGVTKSWTVTYPDGATLVFDGWISAFGANVPLEDKVMTSFTITVSGLPVFTAGGAV